MGEAVTILKGLFAEGPVTFEGRHYHVNGFADLARPIQRPHPPLMIGGGGQKTLSLAAREADIIGLAPRAVRPGVLDVRSCLVQGTSSARWMAWSKNARGCGTGSAFRTSSLAMKSRPSRPSSSASPAAELRLLRR